MIEYTHKMHERFTWTYLLFKKKYTNHKFIFRAVKPNDRSIFGFLARELRSLNIDFWFKLSFICIIYDKYAKQHNI